MQYRPHRYQTEFPLDLHTPSGPQHCKVTDVNNSGARLSGLNGLNRGDKLNLNILCHRVEAVVCWVSRGRLGITFRPQISDDQLDMLRYRPDGRMGHRRGQVGFPYAEMR